MYIGQYHCSKSWQATVRFVIGLLNLNFPYRPHVVWPLITLFLIYPLTSGGLLAACVLLAGDWAWRHLPACQAASTLLCFSPITPDQEWALLLPFLCRKGGVSYVASGKNQAKKYGLFQVNFRTLFCIELKLWTARSHPLTFWSGKNHLLFRTFIPLIIFYFVL